MGRRLTAYLDGRRVGWFTELGDYVQFDFDDDWRVGARRSELSLSIPKSAKRHGGRAPKNWLWGLLPDNERVLERWGRRFDVNARNPMALLAHVGLDAAGSIQLTEHDESVLEGESVLVPISDADIGQHLAELRADPTAWLIALEHPGYFSLAGAQAKFALAQTPEGWAIPSGRAPSTHIFKPGIAGIAESDLGEHLAMNTAARLGLDVAGSQMAIFGGETAIVVERYDRVASADGDVLRLHQEDLVQSAGLHPAVKYRNEGGRGIVSIAAQLRIGARTPEQGHRMVQRFFEANLFGLVIAATDGHAKNYSVLLGADGVTLAPLYDIQSILGHRDVPERDLRLAMSIGGDYLLTGIGSREIREAAGDIGLDGDWAVERTRQLADEVPDALSAAVVASGVRSDFTTRLIDGIALHSRQVTRRLNATTTLPTRDDSTTIPQPRLPTGTPGAGTFAPHASPNARSAVADTPAE